MAPLVPPKLIPGVRLLPAISRLLASSTYKPPLVLLMASSLATLVCRCADVEPMPVAADKLSSTASEESPKILGVLPTKTSTMAPAVLVMDAVAPTCNWLKLTVPPACKLARPLAPSVVMLVPLVMVIAPPAIKVTCPPVSVPVVAPELMLPDKLTSPAVAVKDTALLAPVAVRSIPDWVVMASAAVSVSAPTLVTSILTRISSPEPCALKEMSPKPAPVAGLVTLAATLSSNRRCVASAPVSTVPLITVMLPPKVLKLMSPPLALV